MSKLNQIGLRMAKAAAMVAVVLVLVLATDWGDARGQEVDSAREADAANEADSAQGCDLVTFTTEQDHRNMMGQLGIRRLRPGPSGNPDSPNAANYDESQANPYPDLPEVLKLEDSTEVTTAEMWWQQRRPQIVEQFDREIYGRVPENVPGVEWVVTRTEDTQVADQPVEQRLVEGRVDNCSCPGIEVTMQLTLVLPKEAEQPVPVLMMYGRGAFPGGGRFGRGPSGPTKAEQLISNGWGYAYINPSSIQADNGAGLTRGIIGLTNRGQPRKPDDWGALRAWAWGAARGLDYLETVEGVDAKRVGIEGVSRYGKAALVAMAYEPRFAAVLIGSSGVGGASLLRRNFGEAVENLTGGGQYHWMAGNFLQYGAAEASFGSMNAGDLPVDSHQLLALCAPRLAFISYGVPERGDAHWLDHRGSYMAAVAASPAFRLLGARGLGVSDDYMREKMPDVHQGLLGGELAWRQHDGGHTDTPNITHFVEWAERMWEENRQEGNAPRP